MPAGTVMGHVHLHVGDLERAAAFYHAALGLDKVVWSYPGALFMSAGGYHHHLGTNTWARGSAPTSDHARLLSWDLIVPERHEAAAAAASLASAGFGVREDAGAFTAADPWGTPLRIAAATEGAGQ
jgi:catechol 2,3-dioxygenase